MRFLFVFLFALSFLGCISSDPSLEKNSSLSPALNNSSPTSLPDTKEKAPITQLEFETLRPGQGAPAQGGDQVAVHYVGTFLDGSAFDSSRERDEAFSFVIGEGRVISGWEKGVTGMRIGEIRKLKIPYDMAYGEAGRPPLIPPRTPLIFEIELLDIF